MAYCTVAELKTWNDRTSAAQDPELDAVIDTASAWIDYYCQRSFLVTGSASRVFAPCSPYLLRLGPFNDAATVTAVKTDEGGDGTFETTWSASDYELLPLNPTTYGPEAHPFTQVRSLTRMFPYAYARTRLARVQITGTWGWPTVPSTVRHACLIQASRIFLRRQSPDGVIGGFQDFGPVRVSGRVDPDVADLLRAYQHPSASILVA